MTSMQNFWLAAFNFGPAIVLAIYKQWWVGLVALFATFVLSWLLVFGVSNSLSASALTWLAWMKPVLVGSVVLFAGWHLF